MQLKVNNISKTIRRKKILDSVSMDPLDSRIHAVYQEIQAKRVLPDEKGCCIPLRLDAIPAL
ncbi:MAG: hypothetical protein II627_01840, partial [Lachnospiraceae bacterium]|nr:hypothetical protein [Lachnospiraceae bacterium]